MMAPGEDVNFMRLVKDLTSVDSCVKVDAQLAEYVCSRLRAFFLKEQLYDISLEKKMWSAIAVLNNHGNYDENSVVLMAKYLAQQVSQNFLKFYKDLRAEDQRLFLEKFLKCVDAWANHAGSVRNELCSAFADVARKLQARPTWNLSKDFVANVWEKYMLSSEEHFRSIAWAVLAHVPGLAESSEQRLSVISLFAQDIRSENKDLALEATCSAMSLTMTCKRSPGDGSYELLMLMVESILPHIFCALEELISAGNEKLLQLVIAWILECQDMVESQAEKLVNISVQNAIRTDLDMNVRVLCLQLLQCALSMYGNDPSLVLSQAAKRDILSAMIRIITDELARSVGNASALRSKLRIMTFIESELYSELVRVGETLGEFSRPLSDAITSLLPSDLSINLAMTCAALLVSLSIGRDPSDHLFIRLATEVNAALGRSDMGLHHVCAYITRRLWVFEYKYSEEIQTKELLLAAFRKVLNFLQHRDPRVRSQAYACQSLWHLSKEATEADKKEALGKLVHCVEAELQDLHGTGDPSVLESILLALWKILYKHQGCMGLEKHLLRILSLVACTDGIPSSCKCCPPFLQDSGKMSIKMLNGGEMENVRIAAIRCYLEVVHMDRSEVGTLRFQSVVHAMRSLQPIRPQGDVGESKCNLWRGVSCYFWDRLLSLFDENSAEALQEVLPIAVNFLMRQAAVHPGMEEVEAKLDQWETLHYYDRRRRWDYFYLGNRRYIRVQSQEVEMQQYSIKHLGDLMQDHRTYIRPYLPEIAQLMADLVMFVPWKKNQCLLREGSTNWGSNLVADKAANYLPHLLRAVVEEGDAAVSEIWEIVGPSLVEAIMDGTRWYPLRLLESFVDCLSLLPAGLVVALLPTIVRILDEVLAGFCTKPDEVDALDDEEYCKAVVSGLHPEEYPVLMVRQELAACACIYCIEMEKELISDSNEYQKIVATVIQTVIEKCGPRHAQLSLSGMLGRHGQKLMCPIRGACHPYHQRSIILAISRKWLPMCDPQVADEWISWLWDRFLVLLKKTREDESPPYFGKSLTAWKDLTECFCWLLPLIKEGSLIPMKILSELLDLDTELAAQPPTSPYVISGTISAILLVLKHCSSLLLPEATVRALGQVADRMPPEDPFRVRDIFEELMKGSANTGQAAQ